MSQSKTLLASAVALAALSLCASAAGGVPVTVTLTGTVDYNQITAPPLGNAHTNDVATLTFRLDSSDYLDGTSFPTRGYRIDKASFSLTIGAAQIGLQNPFPANLTPYFVLRDNDPAVDGFFIATNVDVFGGVPLAQAGNFGQFANAFHVTYGGNTLSSLDITDALGTYDYTGLSVYGWTIDDGPFSPLSISYTQMTIECRPQDPVIYCTGKLNSQNCTPAIATDPGSPSVTGGPWNVTATNLLNNKSTIFFYGFGRANIPFQGGTLCVLPPVTRTPVQSSGGNPPPNDCSGVVSIEFAAAFPAALAPAIVNIQAWSRDPGASFGTGFSNAAEILVLP